MKINKYVYIAINNDNRSGIVKIGITQDVYSRPRDLSRPTGVCGKFKYIFLWKCENNKKIEDMIEKHFAAERLSLDKEFYEVDYKKVIGFIKQFEGQECKYEDLLKEQTSIVRIPLKKMKKEEISKNKINEVKRYLKHRYKQCEVVELTKVSRYHVSNIAKEMKESILQNGKRMA
jgi:hypothetical protein